MFGESISFSEGLLVTALGMGVTFAALIGLSLLLDLLRILFYKDPNKNKPVQVTKTPENKETAKASVEDTGNDGQIDGELVAVITAAIAASLNTTTHNIIVKNIMRTEDSTPAWGRAGRADQMNQML